MGLKVGDIVALKSGGPKMTVAAVKSDRAFCVWFNHRDDYHEEKTGEFLVATLRSLQPRAHNVDPKVEQVPPAKPT